jgi:hypothetical protein
MYYRLFDLAFFLLRLSVEIEIRKFLRLTKMSVGVHLFLERERASLLYQAIHRGCLL